VELYLHIPNTLSWHGAQLKKYRDNFTFTFTFILKYETHTKMWSENLKGRDHSEDLGVDGKINIRVGLRDIGWKGVDWMYLGQDMNKWRTFVNTVMNLRRGI
jgi:hypothetical protein